MNLTTKISLRVIAIFAVAIFLTFVPEYNRAFFGDWQCFGTVQVGYMVDAVSSGCNDYGTHNSGTFHWGYRHWLFFFMGLTLAIIQVADIINLLITTSVNNTIK